MDLKRTANSPAESEKVKIPATSSGLMPDAFFRQSVNQAKNNDVEFVSSDDGMEGDDDGSWSWATRRARKWSAGSTGNHLGGTPPPQRKERKAGPSEAFTHRHTVPRFVSKNDGAFRSEIEVEIKTKDGAGFVGTVTRHEAKHVIYKETLGCPFSNFRGVRFGFKGVLVVTFMLKEPINIDDLASFQDFSFVRQYKEGGEDKTSTIGCKIRGVRTVTGADSTPSYSEDWTRMVKIEGCDYKITEEMLLSWLAEYGEIESELVEDVFDDSEDSEGENATGTYSIDPIIIS